MEMKKINSGRLRAIGYTDTLSRPGGDEFLVLLADTRELDAITGVVEKFRKQFSAPFDIEGQYLHASISVGISIYPDDGKDFETLLKSADAAMYQAKNAGKSATPPAKADKQK